MTDYDNSNTRISVHEIIDGRPVPGDWDDFLAHRNDTKRLFRVDISTQESASLNNIINVIHKNPLVVERCLDPDSVSGVYAYNNMLSLQLPIPEDWQASAHPKLSILCLSNALITIRTNTITEYSSALLNNPASIPNQPLGTEGLLFSLLDNIVDRASELTLKARLSVEQLETDMQQIVDEERLGRHILSLKQAAAHFEMALEAKHRTLMALLSLDTELINLRRIREPLHDVVAHVEHSLRYIERVEDHLGELDRHFLLLLHDRTNNRLRLLTIISAIFMPLTLIAGIYGMNFRFMPELSWHYGYGTVLLVMLSLALGLLWYFYRKGWFR
ncbi:MAG: magnesium transporter CorA [bacterium]|nr:MAG: magnesium transporter CorA [bacterium]